MMASDTMAGSALYDVQPHPPRPWRIKIRMFESRSNTRRKENDHVAMPRT